MRFLKVGAEFVAKLHITAVILTHNGSNWVINVKTVDGTTLSEAIPKESGHGKAIADRYLEEWVKKKLEHTVY